MKRRVFLVALVLGTSLLAYGAFAVEDPAKDNELAGKLVGTWKLVSAKYNGQESDVTKSGVTLKHITPGNYMWLTYDAETKEITRAGGGTCTIEGEKYAETGQYGLGPDFQATRDKTHAFTMKLDGDTVHQNGALADGLKIEEVWERVKGK